jgi:hypothetical protein
MTVAVMMIARRAVKAATSENLGSNPAFVDKKRITIYGNLLQKGSVGTLQI